jgi:hypothetical protein
MAAKRTREDRYELRLSEEESEMLTRLAARDGVNGSHVLRRLLREAFAVSGLDTKIRRR